MNVFSDLAWAPQRPDSAVFLIRAGLSLSLSLSLSRNSQYCSYLLQLLHLQSVDLQGVVPQL